jgi:hypothetical protein
LPTTPKFHDGTMKDIRGRFVDATPDKTRRNELFVAYQLHVDSWSAIIGDAPAEDWIDGSFITTKEFPGDIDVVTWIAAESLEQLQPQQRDKLLALFPGTPGGPVHAFAHAVLPDGHPRKGLELRLRLSWIKCFGQGRDGILKGIVRRRGGADT